MGLDSNNSNCGDNDWNLETRASVKKCRRKLAFILATQILVKVDFSNLHLTIATNFYFIKVS